MLGVPIPIIILLALFHHWDASGTRRRRAPRYSSDCLSRHIEEHVAPSDTSDRP